MKIGVLIPVYNAEATIAETLDSVLNQSVLPHEICIVDDGSTDKSGEIIREYAHNDQEHKVVWKIIQQENAGLGAARNRGLSEISSDYVALLDSDDTWASEKLKHVSEYLSAHPHIDLLYHPIWEWTGTGQSIRKRRDGEIHGVEDIWLHNPITPSAVVLRTGLDWTFEIEPSIHGVEDALLWSRAIAEGRKLGRMPNVDTYYRVNHGMTKNWKEHENHVMAGVQLAMNRGWLKNDILEPLKVQRAYYRARNLHKNGEFEEAVNFYRMAESSFKVKLLKLAAQLTISI